MELLDQHDESPNREPSKWPRIIKISLSLLAALDIAGLCVMSVLFGLKSPTVWLVIGCVVLCFVLRYFGRRR